MEALLSAIQDLPPVAALRLSRWGYAAVNATHILGIALLVGAIIPLDLRLLGVWPSIEQKSLVRVLVPVAIFGLGLAIIAGFLLFAVRATEYAALGVFRLKLLLIATGVISALASHAAYGSLLETANPRRLRQIAFISAISWLGALIAGRLIAFLSD